MTGTQMFNTVKNFFESNGLSWNNCVHIYTDGAKSMAGKTACSIAQIKSLA
jgi:hypothetical protein